MKRFERCPGCMLSPVKTYPCPNCDWVADGGVSAHHIKPSTLLKDRYYIGRVLGQGGFGITYLGWDFVLDVKIAVKEYFPLSLVTRDPQSMRVSCADASASEDFEYGLEKFLSEARILASFSDCPNIVSTKDFFSEYGTAYMVMEHIDGTDLKRYLDKHSGRMPWHQARGVIMHIADALKDVHSKGLLHRDISPDNIFITSRGQVKLLDFGAARFAFGMQNKSLSVVLKPGYAPVEQYQTRGNQGPWTDIYSLGATLYRSITGMLPPESLDRLEADSLASPTSLGISLPDTIEAALLTALALKPKDRFQSIQDFQRALTDDAVPDTPAEESRVASHGTPTVAYSDDDRFVPSRKNITPPHSERSSKKTRILLAIAFLLAAAFTFFFFIWGDSGERVAIGKSVQTPMAAPPAENNELPETKQNEAEPPGAPATVAQAERRVARDEELERLFADAGRYAVGLDREKDLAEALALYEKAGEMGHAGAMLAAAAIYQLGHGVPIDRSKAADWYEKAAGAGSVEGAISLANIILEGGGGEHGYAKIVDVLGRFADGDNIEACYLIGRAYEEGDATLPRDLRQARNYLRLPARVNYMDSADRLKVISARLDS